MRTTDDAPLRFVYLIFLVAWFALLFKLFPRGIFPNGDGGINLMIMIFAALIGAGVSTFALSLIVRALPYWLVFVAPIAGFLTFAYSTETPPEGFAAAAIYGVILGAALIGLKALAMATVQLKK